jgi:hypothetical protein
MQQSTSSSISETHFMTQEFTLTEFIKKWTIDDIEFFDSEFEENESVINVERHVFYRDIYVFVDRLKNMMNLRKKNKLRAILSQCFREAVLIWHFTKLSNMKKDLLRQASLTSWYQVMINRFKQRTSIALITLQQSRYFMTDARSDKNSRLYAQDIFRSIKVANMNSIHNQLTIAWNNLDWQFRINISKSIVTTSIRKFLKQLNFMSDIWHEMTRSQSQNQFKSLRDRFQNTRRIQNYSEYSFRSNASLFISYQNQNAYSNNQSSYQFDHRQYERFEYRNRNIRSYNSRNNRFIDSRYFRKKSSELASVLSFARQSLQITSENAIQNASGFSYQETKSKNNRDYKSKDRAYVTEKDKHDNEIENYSSENEYYHESNSELDYYNSNLNDHDQFDVEINFFISTQTFRCRKCKAIFSSNNQLHKHVRQNICENINISVRDTTFKEKIMNESIVNFVMNILVLKFSIDFSKNVDTDFEFRKWIYAKTMITLFDKTDETQVCLDIECSVILADKLFVQKQISQIRIRYMITLLNVRDLDTNKHQTSKYFIVTIYFTEKLEEKSVREFIRRKVHLINNLKANMLIDNDILRSEDIFIDEANNKATIVSCNNMIISVEIRTFSKEMINKILHARAIIMISFYSMTIISIHNANLSSNRDFLFEPDDTDISLYAHAINDSITAIMTKNLISKIVKISRNDRLRKITKIQYLNAFHANSETNLQNYVERTSRRIHKISWFNRVLRAVAVAYVAVFIMFTSNDQNIIHKTDVIIHNFTSQTVFIFSNLIEQYSDLWKSEEFVKLFENEWMRISLRSNWKTKIFGKVKIYSLETENKKLVDQTFNDLQAKERLKYIIKSTFFSYSVFVVWKTVNDKKKKRMIIDIRELNFITLLDAYFLFLQSNIISTVKKCHFLSIINCAFFFYQWRVHFENRHKLTIVSHRGQKIFQIAVMKYKNSSSYVQRQIDRLFRELSFVKAFIDDIIIYSRIMNEHVDHLKQIFQILIRNEIFVNLKKIFLKYFFVQLLDQRIDFLNLFTDEKKLKIIVKLKFSRTLRQLETYLDLTEWMREYVTNYSVVSQLLQDRKTLLLKNSSIFGRARQKFSFNIRLLNLIVAEKQSFEQIQSALSKRRKLIHVDIERQLYDDVDVSKKFGIDVMIYHVKNDEENLFIYSTKSKIELILFLSRQLKSIEKNYWSTELKIADIVFIIRKIRHMIESSKKLTILFTDHEFALNIVKQTSLIITSIDRLNLRLIRAFEYIQRFNLIIKHKSNKQHIVSDALSRLVSENDDSNTLESKELNALFIITLVEMSSEFKFKIIFEYFSDSRWKKLILMLFKNIITRLAAGLGFEHVGQPDPIQSSGWTKNFVRRVGSGFSYCSTFKSDPRDCSKS